MFTPAKRIGLGAIVGLAALAAVGEVSAQGLRVGAGQGANPGGARPFVPNAGVGFNYSSYAAGGAAAPGGSIFSSPYASMTSSGGASPYDSGSSPYGYGNYVLPDPYSGYLRGSADVINAQGKYLVNTQQAYLLKEQVRQAQTENRRRIFDEYLYEKANTPTLNDVREASIRDEIRRSKNEPPPTEIWSGKALNDLMGDIRKLQDKKLLGPNVPIDEEVLKKINLTGRDDGSNFGMLKNGPKLNWPLALRGKDAESVRDQMQTLVKKAYDEAKAGQAIDPGTFAEMDRIHRQLNDQLVKRVNSEAFGDYNDAKGFLRQLDSSIKALKQPDASKVINGGMVPQGANVADLVKFMNEKGLSFAPATNGEYAAYIALHRALVAYDVGATNTGADR